ncbi:hypothetical protein [Acaryochloris sp. IP29b_bin.137]|uniref:hypothetical protein n=1 Tax=Acaryochloris sp. IP29b_bin.137 TaxID=2969217 RepID=UPI00262E2842|nr:hypothetical protein [Acaryochloris sp. IP29b_bin.137]
MKRWLQVLFAIATHPRYLLVFSLGRLTIIRTLHHVIFRKENAVKHNTEDSLFVVDTSLNITKSLQEHGIFKGIYLPETIKNEILGFADRPCLSSSQNESRCSVPKHSLIGEELSSCDAIRRVEADPLLWDIATQYFQREPIRLDTLLRWTSVKNPTPDWRKKYTFHYHFDLEDYHSIKFMFYLTDVDMGGGPHVCVRGTHHYKKLRHQLAASRVKSEKDIIGSYGPDRIDVITGPSGFGFVEDFHCFHKATFPTRTDRLVLEIRFVTRDYGVVL